MTERQINIPLSKIVSVRIHCRNQGCGAIIETNLDDLRHKFRHGKCPFCHAQLITPTTNAFDLLNQAIASLAANGEHMDFAFVYREEDGLFADL
jgi:hypothetical protein